jgi:hypothetical protein
VHTGNNDSRVNRVFKDSAENNETALATDGNVIKNWALAG